MYKWITGLPWNISALPFESLLLLRLYHYIPHNIRVSSLKSRNVCDFLHIFLCPTQSIPPSETRKKHFTTELKILAHQCTIIFQAFVSHPSVPFDYSTGEGVSETDTDTHPWAVTKCKNPPLPPLYFSPCSCTIVVSFSNFINASEGKTRKARLIDQYPLLKSLPSCERASIPPSSGTNCKCETSPRDVSDRAD